MRGLIPDELVAEVLDRVDIAELIGEYVRLEKKGRSLWGLCPFHQEKTPSFSVTPDKQMFYCFGCGVGGNAYKFIMLKENLDFPESVRFLAGRVGIRIPEYQPAAVRKHERLWGANALAAEFYQSVLEREAVAEGARQYLARRGLSVETLRKFQLGYAPPRWDALLEFLGRHGYSPEELAGYGLAVRGERGRIYDRFRNRVIFPVANSRGKIVGFGGRVMDDSQPKYLNSPETAIFSKGQELYALNLARQAIREAGFAVIVEGYMDAIAAHQFGQSNVVASLGTALTREQAKLLTRCTMDVVIAYDADFAGETATLRGLDILKDLGCRVRVVSIPDGKDPDDFLKTHGAEEWQALVDKAVPLLEYRLQHAIRQTGARTTVQKLAVLHQVLPSLHSLASEVEKEEGIRLIARSLSLSLDTVKAELTKYAAEHAENWPDSDKIAKNLHNIIIKRPQARQRAEAGLLYQAIENPACIEIARQELGDQFFTDASYQRIFNVLVRHATQPGFKPALLATYLDEADQAAFSALMSGFGEIEARPGLSELIPALKRLIAKEKRQALLADLAAAEQAGDHEQAARLKIAINQLCTSSLKGGSENAGGVI
ncbi:DNA primase [Desulforudis sp. 1088]|uniref:DNA primase n=1 Tax=unclassified Candidatus Desulforudis TaxID=2635950 RepID=UPI0034972C9D